MGGSIDRLLARLDRLIEKGKTVMSTHRPPPQGVISAGSVDSTAFTEWRAQTMHLLAGLLGEGAVYTKRFEADVEHPSPGDVNRGMGTLRAVREDAANGDLVDIRTLVAGEVFSDFLEMAAHLLQAGYPIPAASLAGAVLEDGLRRIAEARGVEVGARDGAGTINGKLAGAAVHTPLEQKRLAVAIEVRNNADHGNFADVNAESVREMLGIVEGYLASHLTASPG